MRWLIAQACLLAVVLGVSLSGYGMAQAHTAMMLDATMADHGADHPAAHSDMDHAGHDMTSEGHGPAHDSHASCPMIACCHTGGVSTPAIPAVTDTITCQHLPSISLQLDKAEPESAKKPPKHV